MVGRKAEKDLNENEHSGKTEVKYSYCLWGTDMSSRFK
jgi:hypothetical protein